jgi:dihydroorotate dehydrogenase
MSLYRAVSPLISRLEPEAAHRLTIRALKWGAGVLWRARADPRALRLSVLGMRLRNPIGLAAGFDKDGEVAGALVRMGFGFVEAGTVTPLPQAGNPRPRLFRLREDRAIINRMGFNNEGAASLAARLGRDRPAGVIGINIGANRGTKDMAADYVTAYSYVAPYADYIALNVSSPNTAGLRTLQERAPLQDLLARVNVARAKAARSLPIFLKISPDLDALGLETIVELAIEARLSGLIVSNTTTGARAGLQGPHAAEVGGLSGAPLFRRSTDCLAEVHRLAGRRLTLIGVGGVFSARDAYEKILAGATLVQLYTALVYEGPGLLRRIKVGLVRLLASDGFASVADAVGAGAAAAKSTPLIAAQADPATTKADEALTVRRRGLSP